VFCLSQAPVMGNGASAAEEGSRASQDHMASVIASPGKCSVFRVRFNVVGSKLVIRQSQEFDTWRR